MSTHASLARRWFKEVWVDGGEATVRELMAERVRGYMEGGVDIHNRDEFLAAREQFLETFPDLSVVVEDVIEEESKVVIRWRATTGRQSFRGMTWLEFEHGQIVLGWDSWNLGGLMQSLNVGAAM